MRGNRGVQRNGYQRVRRNGYYDEFPIEVREFLEICEGIVRRMMTEKGTIDKHKRAENYLQGSDEEEKC